MGKAGSAVRHNKRKQNVHLPFSSLPSREGRTLPFSLIHERVSWKQPSLFPVFDLDKRGLVRILVVPMGKVGSISLLLRDIAYESPLPGGTFRLLWGRSSVWENVPISIGKVTREEKVRSGTIARHDAQRFFFPGAVVQFGRTSDWQSEGHGFEPRRLHHIL